MKRICDDAKKMGMYELAHNCAYIKDGETWYRDFEREISLRDLMRELYKTHLSIDGLNDNELDEKLCCDLAEGTDEIEGLIALLNVTLIAISDLREWLKEAERGKGEKNG